MASFWTLDAFASISCIGPTQETMSIEGFYASVLVSSTVFDSINQDFFPGSITLGSILALPYLSLSLQEVCHLLKHVLLLLDQALFTQKT